MRRTYRVPAHIDSVDANVRRIFADVGAPYASAFNQAGTIEAVLNAIIHGVFRVAAGPDRDPIAFLDALRAAEAAHEGEEVYVAVEHAPGSDVCTVVVSDPGDGFDTQAAMKRLDAMDPLAPSGRGLLLMSASAEAVTWNAVGNEVTLRFRSAVALVNEPCSSRYI
jgi:anti-sigma regulatory factor (Ser/Thr protein kinase)